MNITRVALEATANAADFTYSLTNAALFAGLEVYIGIITACLPTLGPLISKERRNYSGQKRKLYTPGDRPSVRSASKGKSGRQTFDERAFEQLGDDDIPLRQVLAHGGINDDRAAWTDSHGDTSASQSKTGMVPDGVINVRTDLQVFKSQV